MRSSNILLDEKKTKSSIKVKAGQYISYSKSISFNQEYKKNSFSMIEPIKNKIDLESLLNLGAL